MNYGLGARIRELIRAGIATDEGDAAELLAIEADIKRLRSRHVSRTNPNDDYELDW